jgi:hypothetical protein
MTIFVKKIVMKKKEGKNIECKCCKKKFYVPKYRIETARFCSIECQNYKQYIKSKHKCLQCSKEFEDSPSRIGKRKFCSTDCYSENKRVYKDTQSKRRAQKTLVNNKRGINWSTNNRKHVFALKEKKCVKCGYNEYDFCLDVHHIDHNPNNNDISNLELLCVICHRKLHKGIIN